MATSRYKYTSTIIDEATGKPRTAVFTYVSAQDIADNSDIFITFRSDMRLDQLANKYLGDGRYWWMICLANDISLPFSNSLTPGTIIRIPISASRILNIIETKTGNK